MTITPNGSSQPTPQTANSPWLVACSDDAALPRLIARNAFSEAEAKQRLGSQRPWQQRAAAADLVLHNDNGAEEFVDTVRYAFRRLWELRRSSALPRSHYHTWRAAHPVPVSVPA